MKKVTVLLVTLCFSFINVAMAAPIYPVTEASIMVPLTGPNGQDLTILHQTIKKTMVNHWKSFMVTPISNGQMSSTGEVVEERKVLYTVAFQCEHHQTSKLSDIVALVKEMAQVESVYVKQCSGHVQIL